MKRVAGSFVVLALTAAGVVAAQTTSPSTSPSDRSSYPSNSTTSPSSTSPSSSGSYNSSSGNYGTSGKSHDQQMKDCMAQQQASNPSMSKSDMKKACKSQMQSSGSNPQR